MSTIKVISSEKFNTNLISLHFVHELTVEDAGKMAVLVNIMVDRCEKYPSKQAISQQLDLFYGASISSKVSALGKSQSLEIQMSFLNDKVIDEIILEKTIAFLAEMVYHPLITEETVKEARELHYDMLKRSLDDPANYLQQKAFEIAGKQQALGINSNGNAEEILEITLEDMIDCYKKLMNKSQLFVHMIGDVDEEETEKVISKYFKQTKELKPIPSFYSFSPIEINERTENKNFTQSYVITIYNHDITVADPRYWALRVGNALFGQLPSSFLFQEIREKRSLSYSIYSTQLAFDSIIYATAGIQTSQEEEVVELIKQQLEKVCNGDFDESLLNTTKEMLINMFKSSLDYQATVLGLAFQNSLLQRDKSVEDIVKEIQEVEKEEVVNAMKQLCLNTVFVLKGELHGESNES